jgi:hypothetical protein
MRKNETLLNKRVSVRSMGTFLSSSVLVAVVAGLFWHRRAIKRLVEISRM